MLQLKVKTGALPPEVPKFNFAETEAVKNYAADKAEHVAVKIIEEFEKFLKCDKNNYIIYRVIPLVPDSELDPSLFELFKKKTFENLEKEQAQMIKKNWNLIQKDILDAIIAQTEDRINQVVTQAINLPGSETTYKVITDSHELLFRGKDNEKIGPKQITYIDSHTNKVFYKAKELTQFHFSSDPEGRDTRGKFGVDVFIKVKNEKPCTIQ